MYELQGRWPDGTWDAANVSLNPASTLFTTRAEAEAALEDWVADGRRRQDLRIVAHTEDLTAAACPEPWDDDRAPSRPDHRCPSCGRPGTGEPWAPPCPPRRP